MFSCIFITHVTQWEQQYFLILCFSLICSTKVFLIEERIFSLPCSLWMSSYLNSIWLNSSDTVPKNTGAGRSMHPTFCIWKKRKEFNSVSLPHLPEVILLFFLSSKGPTTQPLCLFSAPGIFEEILIVYLCFLPTTPQILFPCLIAIYICFTRNIIVLFSVHLDWGNLPIFF